MYNSAKQVLAFHGDAVALVGKARADMRDRREANRKRLKKGLSDNDDPKPIGCHTQGSYAMHTMIQDVNLDYDIDDGVYFRIEDLVGERNAAMTALAVRKMVCAALQSDQFARAPEVRKNCVRVFYNEGYHVDIPSYRRSQSTDLWTGKLTSSYELAGADWRASDPKEVTRWFRKTNKDLSPDLGEGQFRRIARLLKKFSKSRSSWKGKNPSGFALTKLASELFVPRLNRDDVSLRETMTAMSRRLAYNTQISHPIIDEYLVKSDDGKGGHLRDRLDENLRHLDVLDDFSCTHDDAMEAWDKVFSTDWFRNQPPPSDGGDDDGSPKSPVDKRGRGEFASLK